MTSYRKQRREGERGMKADRERAAPKKKGTQMSDITDAKPKPPINTQCGGCGTIGPYDRRPVCPLCGHDNSPKAGA